MRKAITPEQVKLVHTLTHALGLPDDDYRAILWAQFKAKSCKDLDCGQARNLLDDLEAKAVAAGVWQKQAGSRKKYNNLNYRDGMASPAQLRMVEGLWAEVSHAEEPDARNRALRSFLERIAKVSDARFLTGTGAQKVITGLKAMQAANGPNAKKAA
jgi:hypothetical protein